MDVSGSSDVDLNRCQDRIVSQWGEVSANKKHKRRKGVNEILRPLGYETRLLVIRRANSITLCFFCMTLSALMSLRDQWRTGQLRRIVQSLFILLALGDSVCVHVKRLTWPVADYERCLQFFSSVKGRLSHRCSRELFA